MGKYLKFGTAFILLVCAAAVCWKVADRRTPEKAGTRESRTAQESGSADGSNTEGISVIKDGFTDRVESHPAFLSYCDGKWKIRYISRIDESTDRLKRINIYLSANIPEDMTEEEMLDIMDYYELVYNAKYDMSGNYIGERETDFACYAVFFRGETDEEIRRIKYFNNREVTPTEEEESWFPGAILYTKEEDLGDWP